MRSAFDRLDVFERCARRRRQRVERRCQLCRGAAVDEREGTALGGSHIRRIRAQQDRHRLARTGELAHLAAATALCQTQGQSIGGRDILTNVERRLDTVAVEIRGDSLGAFFNRWLVFYDDVRRPVTPDLIGELCIVGLEDGRILIKQIQRSKTEGLFNLISSTEKPIADVAIEWAARVNSIGRRSRT